MVFEIPFLDGNSLKHDTISTRHSSTIIFGAFLKGSDTHLHLVLSLTDRTPLSIIETCCPVAHISTCADTLFSNFWNSLSVLTVFIKKPCRLTIPNTFQRC